MIGAEPVQHFPVASASLLFRTRCNCGCETGREAWRRPRPSTSRARRARILESVQRRSVSIAVIFVEVICDDRKVVEANMRNKVENSPDFEGIAFESAMEDLAARVAKYEAVYETLEDDEGSYIKLFNLSSKALANHCYGAISRSVIQTPLWL